MSAHSLERPSIDTTPPDTYAVTFYAVDSYDGHPAAYPQSAHTAPAVQQNADGLINAHFADFYSTNVPRPHDAEKIINTAKRFIERTIGIKPTSPVVWNNDLGVNYGQVNIFDGKVVMRDIPAPTSEFMRSMQLHSIAVHEMAHATGLDQRKTIAFTRLNDNEPYVECIEGKLGMMVVKAIRHENTFTLQRQCEFFEEAFAEESATRWREYAIPGHAENGHKMQNTPLDIPMPCRYFNYSEPPTDDNDPEMQFMISALAAYGLRLLSDASHTDLYQLMIDGRQPGNAAAAKQKMIAAIDSIQPNLYQDLRQLEYNPDGFIHGLKLIQAATNEL